jgi:type VI secretion system protein VasD
MCATPQILKDRRHVLSAAALVACPLLGYLVGCASKAAPEPSPASLGGEVTADADLNLSANARPSPLPLRLFELRAATAFNRADFLSLYQADLQALGAELLAREELVLAPGESRVLQKVLNPDTRFIGVFGAYRAFERAVWRAVAPVQPGKRHQLQIRAASLAVSLQLQVV